MALVKAFARGDRVRVRGVRRFDGLTGIVTEHRTDPKTKLPAIYYVAFDDYSDEIATDENPAPKSNGFDKGEVNGAGQLVMSPLGPYHDFPIEALEDV